MATFGFNSVGRYIPPTEKRNNRQENQKIDSIIMEGQDSLLKKVLGKMKIRISRAKAKFLEKYMGVEERGNM